MIISFAWTTPALLAGAKSCTRREWDDGYARRFRDGELVDAYDRSPRAGGHKVATVRLTVAPTFELMRAMPDGDYEAEGFAWLYAHPEALPKRFRGNSAALESFSRAGFAAWRSEPGSMWVVRFELVAP